VSSKGGERKHDFYDLPGWVERHYKTKEGDIEIPGEVIEGVIVEYEEYKRYKMDP